MRVPKPSCRIIPFTCVTCTTGITSTACLGRANTAKSHPACDFSACFEGSGDGPAP